MAHYRTTKDIVIPAGTVLPPPPTASTRWGKNHEATIELGPDHTGYFSLDVKSAVASGVIEWVK